MAIKGEYRRSSPNAIFSNFFNSVAPAGKESFQGEMVLKVFRLYFQIKPGRINELVRATSFFGSIF